MILEIMAQELVEKQTTDAETKPYPNYRLILLNDNHNTFEHVQRSLMRHLPGMSSDRAKSLTVKAHNEGKATVWVGPKEVAELYYELLKSDGLSVRIEPDA